jgi:hypothetical protein
MASQTREKVIGRAITVTFSSRGKWFFLEKYPMITREKYASRAQIRSAGKSR